MQARVDAVLRALEAAATPAYRQDMARRYGIVTDKAFGTPMAEIQKIAKPLAPDHDLAAALWDTGWYEARIACAFIDDPALVTPEQMDRWRADFDNWGVVDTLCFVLFDKSPHAFAKVAAWASLNDEYGRRSSFALLACLALHAKDGPDEPYLEGLRLIEANAADPRNFVRKAASWALRAIGLRKSPELKRAALNLAERLAASTDKTERWIGKDAVKALQKSART